MNVVSYPMFDLSTVVEILNKAIKAGKVINKQILANASTQSNKASTTSGIFNQKLAAFKHYNLAKVENNLVEFTSLAEEISNNNSEATKTAFLAPSTFKELYTSVEKNASLDRNLLEDLANLQIGITNAGKKRFVKNFIKSGIYASLIVHSLESADEVIVLERDTTQNKEPLATSKNIVPSQSESTENQKAELRTSKGKAFIVVPEKLTIEDKEKLKKQIDLF